MTVEILHGDCVEVMRSLPDNCVHSVVTDPPYELGFMGKAWDATGVANSVEMWSEVRRVLRPGGHLLAFSGTRTYHRMTCAIEDAGFEVRDQIGWVYGSGFPKSHDTAKAVHGHLTVGGSSPRNRRQAEMGADYQEGETAGLVGVERAMERVRAPARPMTHADLHERARPWQGWGTALKPAWEPICLARKPLVGTVAENVLAHGTGAINVDGCRVPHQSEADRAAATPQGRVTAKSGALAGGTQHDGGRSEFARPDTTLGRWPANLIHDGSDEVVRLFPRVKTGGPGVTKANNASPVYSGPASSRDRQTVGYADIGSAARFFYCAKASKKDRAGSRHPTVKPVALMRYLVRLVTPPGGVVLDPFGGSGTTGQAAREEGFDAILIEREAEYVADIRRRLAHSDAPLLELA